jgi:hypothetical protein
MTTLVRKVCSDADVADSIVGFHAQQAAEKLIKAVLAARGVTFVKSHALGYLIGLVEETTSRHQTSFPRLTCSRHGQSSSATRARSHPLWIDLRPSSWSHNSERGLKARSGPQTSRRTLTSDSRMRISLSRRGARFEQRPYTRQKRGWRESPRNLRGP